MSLQTRVLFTASVFCSFFRARVSCQPSPKRSFTTLVEAHVSSPSKKLPPNCSKAPPTNPRVVGKVHLQHIPFDSGPPNAEQKLTARFLAASFSSLSIPATKITSRPAGNPPRQLSTCHFVTFVRPYILSDFDVNTLHTQDPPHDIREVAVRDKSGASGPHDFAVFRDEADVSNTSEAAPPPPPPLTVAKTGANGSVFRVAKEGASPPGGPRDGDDVSGVPIRDVSGVTTAPVVATPDPTPVASEALERTQQRQPERAENGAEKKRKDVGGGTPNFPTRANVSVKKPAAIADVTIKDPAEESVAAGMGDEDSVDIGETVEDVKKQLKGALETLKEGRFPFGDSGLRKTGANSALVHFQFWCFAVF